MKKRFLLLTMLAAVLLMCSCETEHHPEELQHHWVLTNHSCGSDEEMMTLTFDDEELRVEEACKNAKPFPRGDSRWCYDVGEDSQLTIWYSDSDYYWDGEDYTCTDDVTSYEFHYSLSEDGRYLTLEYYKHRLFGEDEMYTYVFFRR